jgi:hypothetical protein
VDEREAGQFRKSHLVYVRGATVAIIAIHQVDRQRRGAAGVTATNGRSRPRACTVACASSGWDRWLPPRQKTQAGESGMDDGAYVERLVSCVGAIANEPESNGTWSELEVALAAWRELHDGGEVSPEYLDDNLEVLLSSQAVTSIFHVSRMQPSVHTRRSIILAKDVWLRMVAAIERAAIVSQIRSAHSRRECLSPCSAGAERSPVTSPRFRPIGLHGGALSPTPKCK